MAWPLPSSPQASCSSFKLPVKMTTDWPALSAPSSPAASTTSEVICGGSHFQASKTVVVDLVVVHAGVGPATGKRSASFSGAETCEEATGDDELSDDASLAGEKKRRLNVEQVRTLEKSFELGNKLEPERKMQLAAALGLRPRQVAIWFQNRRARWKTKQLEKDYDVLRRQFDAINAENEALKAHNKKLQTEVLALRGREASDLINLNKETEGSCSNRSENSSEINLDISRTPVAERSCPPLQILPYFQSVRPADPDCPKVENDAPEGSFSNLLCSIGDQPAFWPWSEHHNFQ
ncbi:hypothetical protein BHE74_00028479 [Ensete ventricosum]|nr:hypothetical protein GW17_00027605 [Ensete ventricosum]RWW64295.1 hypothetical protein BHE74_00028479 [Ensete ventricosum]